MNVRRLGAAAFAGAVVLAGCGGSYQKFYQPHVDEACKSGHGDDCWLLGEMYMGKASWSYYKDWSLPVDQAKARSSYVRGCNLGSLRSCTALIERHLLDDDPPARAQVMKVIESLGGTVLSDEEVAQEDADLRERAEADSEHRSQTEAENTREALRQASGALAQGGQQISQRLREQEAANAARRSRVASSGSTGSTASTSKGASATKHAAPVPTLIPNAPSGPKCTPNLGTGCNQLACCEGTHMPGSMDPKQVDCEKDRCCLGFTMPCDLPQDCCQEKSLSPVVCAPYHGGQRRCCREKGAGCTGHCEYCCNGDDRDKFYGDQTQASCL